MIRHRELKFSGAFVDALQSLPNTAHDLVSSNFGQFNAQKSESSQIAQKNTQKVLPEGCFHSYCVSIFFLFSSRQMQVLIAFNYSELKLRKEKSKAIKSINFLERSRFPFS